MAAGYDEVALGGFSQGSLVALHLGLRHAGRVDGLALMSGLFVDGELWRDFGACPARTFQCHGRQDPVVPFGEGERLRDFLMGLNPGTASTPSTEATASPPRRWRNSRRFWG